MNMFEWQKPAWTAWTSLRGRLPHAVLIQSGEGWGEFEFAMGIAQSLLCETPKPDTAACGACSACTWFGLGNHPDFRLIVPESLAPQPEEGAEPGKKRSDQVRIEQVRDLGDFLAVGTHRAGLRVILIYPAEAMNANTQNALLKSLEEPPPATIFLLVATQPDRLLPTVRSRCLKFALPQPDSAGAAAWLKEQGVESPELALAAVGGAPLAALKASAAEADRLAFINGIRRPRFDPVALAETVQRVPLPDLVVWLQRWSFDLLLSRSAGRVRYHVGHEKALAEIALRCQPASIAAYLRRLAEARSLAKHPLNPKLFVEDLLLQYQRLVGQP
jgi:DNA polymerase III subunit delta'